MDLVEGGKHSGVPAPSDPKYHVGPEESFKSVPANDTDLRSPSVGFGACIPLVASTDVCPKYSNCVQDQVVKEIHLSTK